MKSFKSSLSFRFNFRVAAVHYRWVSGVGWVEWDPLAIELYCTLEESRVVFS